VRRVFLIGAILPILWLRVIAEEPPLSLVKTPVGEASAQVNFDADGTLPVPSFDMPFSSFASREALDAYVANRAKRAAALGLSRDMEIGALRKRADEESILPLLRKQQARWRNLLNIEPWEVEGVDTEIFTPKAGVAPANKNRVLINVHGGGFMVGARTGGQLESIPIAAIGRIKVISVDYRMAPEYAFPAASEDVAAIYQTLLHDYKPQNIGIYGCSAGGMLVAQATAWLIEKKLPVPGAIGTFGATGESPWKGDSGHLAYRVYGTSADRIGDSGLEVLYYLKGVSVDNPLVAPGCARRSCWPSFRPRCF
jgi:acetyl esterase/lipase